MADASTKSILRVNLLLINTLKHSKAKHVGQVKPLESAVEDVVADLHESGRSFNKLLMPRALQHRIHLTARLSSPSSA
jgi:hypothetical protein